MSEIESQDTKVSETPANVEAEPTLSLTDLAKQVAALQSTNSRLLDEAKKHKSTKDEWKTKYETKEREELESQGQYKALFEKRGEEIVSLGEQLKSRDQVIVRERVTTKLSSEAAKVGCVDVDALMKLGNSSLLQYDEDSGGIDGVEVFLEEAKSKMPYLFSTAKQTTVNPTVPGGFVGATKTLTAADIARLPEAERNAVLVDLMKKQ